MIWLAAFLLGVTAALPFLVEQRKPDIDDASRDEAAGRFAELSDGKTYHRWQGPEDGPVLVCIHGLTTPSMVFRALVPGLAALGFRVLSYDLYGRGLSDRPRGAQTRHFFIRQLRDLLQDQGIAGDITLLGYSMGGSIATVFAYEEPGRLRRLILLAPAGLVHVPGAVARVATSVPLLGDWLMLALGGWSLRRGARRALAEGSAARKIAGQQRAEIARRGYLPAVLSSQRNMLAEELEEEHRALAKAAVPVQAIWGEMDTVIPLRAMGRLTECNRNLRQSVIEGAGHGLAYTHADEVLQRLKRG